MQNFIKSGVLIALSVMLFSVVGCQKDDNVHKNVETQKVFEAGFLIYKKSNPDDKHTFKIRFESEKPLPKNKELFTKYVKEHEREIKGTFYMGLDDKIIPHSRVVNGIETRIQQKDKVLVSSYVPRDPTKCTFNGISYCTQDKIDDMNFLEKIFCIAEGWGCVMANFASCAWENCGGEDFVTKDLGINK